jgi:(E)-4-hydroxy-3-methylbut-2-enyl-diphosphate synthase
MLWMKGRISMETTKIAQEVPIFLFIPKGTPFHRIVKRKKILREWGITALWVEIDAGRGLPQNLEGLEEGFDIVGQTNTNDDAILPRLFDLPLTGIAVGPEGVERLLAHRDPVASRDLKVYLTQSAEGLSDPGTLLDQLSESLQRLQNAGLGRLSFQVSNHDVTLLFSLHRTLEEKLGVRGVVSLTPLRDERETLYETALRVGSLFHDDLAEAVLITPAGRTAFSSSLVRRQTETIREALGMIGRHPRAFSLISCPSCGRCEIDIPDMADKVHRLLRALETRYLREGVRLEEAGCITVAVMGCNVNGPGEARGADIGIAGGKRGTGTIFRDGKPVITLSGRELLIEFEQAVRELVKDRLAERR